MDLEDICGLLESVKKGLDLLCPEEVHKARGRVNNLSPTPPPGGPTGTLYCPRCGDIQKMVIQAPPYLCRWLIERLSSRPSVGLGPVRSRGSGPRQWTLEDLVREDAPLVFRYHCLRCDATFTAIVYEQSGEPNLVVLPAVSGGIRTPHTPDGVAYYLDQAQRARSVGAHSAAAAMYRAALEQLLFEQGSKERTLSRRIDALEKSREAPDAPKWVRDLDSRFMKVLKDLGNAAIHPNDGDVTRQAAFDQECLNDISETFLELLSLVYEREHETRERLGRLGKKVETFDRQGRSKAEPESGRPGG